MDESIYDLYLAYKGKLIDDDFINKVFELMVQREPCLLHYINDFIISEDDGQNRGTYAPKSREITIYKNVINENSLDRPGISGIETIRHEMEHARNVRTLEENRGDIESRVLRTSANLDDRINDLLCDNNSNSIELLSLLCTKTIVYNYNPDERLAAIRGWKYIVNLLKNQRRSEDLLFARINLFNAYIRGYEDNGYYLDCPTYTFLLSTDQANNIKYIKRDVKQKQYIFDTRLMYGLPITYEEYDDEILNKVLLQRKKQ